MGNGDFEIECTPGSIASQNRTREKDLAYAWLVSEDIRLERRQSNMGWKMSFALMNEYVQTTQNASIARKGENRTRSDDRKLRRERL